MECFVLLNPSTPESLANSVKYDSSLISFSAPWQGQQFFNICELSIVYSYSFKFFIFWFCSLVSKFSELFSYASSVLPGINSTYVFCGRVFSELNRIDG